MIDLIRSQDYKDFLNQKRITLTAFQTATLIFHHPKATYKKKIDLLKELMNDTDHQVLFHQIQGKINKYSISIEMFKENDISKTCYQLYTWFHDKYLEYGLYTNYENAYTQGLEIKEPFKIEKCTFEDKENEINVCEILGSLSFDSNGSLIGEYLNLYMFQENDWQGEYPSFENTFLDLPMLFRRGDIVHIINTDIYGIVGSPKDDADEEEYRALLKYSKNNEYYDWPIFVSTVFDGTTYLPIHSHKHVPPTDLEYARLDDSDPRKGFLEYMKKTLLNKSLFGTGRDKGRIHMLLVELEKVWKQ